MVKNVIGKYLSILVLAWSASVSAEPRLWGIDALGMARWSNEAIDAIPPGVAVGVFTQRELFGPGALEHLERVLSKGKTPLVRYHLRWSDTHSFPRSDWGKIIAEARRVSEVIERYPSVECQVSGATEHQLNSKDARDLANLVLAAIPSRCVYVNNPWGKGAYIVGDRIMNEVHGRAAKRPAIGGRYNFSFDGDAAEDADVTSFKQRMNDADVFFMWGPRFNGHWEMGSTVPRPERKGWPDAKYVQSLMALTKDKGSTYIVKGGLYKSHAENKGNGDKRAEKPVLLLKSKSSFVTVGGVTCPYFGTFENGQYRYYCSSKWGYEVSDTPVDVKVSGKVVGRVNPAFREGYFK
jgi:hypothetical protein